MRFLDSWTELSLFDLVRLLAPAVFLAAAVFLPGRRVARWTAFLLALAIPWLRELGTSALIAGGWVALWLLVAWQAGVVKVSAASRPLAATRGTLETGAVGFLLALSVLALLVAAVARQDLGPEDGRRASLGVLIVGLGLLHLMLRRHGRRATLAFAALGLGLQVLDGVARGAQVPATLPVQGAVLLGTALAVVLAVRIASNRELHTGSAWISDAHDLHD
ncbi:MAG TPA: hypothetical protein VEY91_07990 [Candidatus Limnocylindria bacterium]|nr:hypothetical protein [Candidatus Limnocylindria bacterium]